MSNQSERSRDRRSLQDLAKMASSPELMGPPSGLLRAVDSSKPAIEKEDSGIVDLKAAAASDPMGADRALATPLASAGLFDDDENDARISRAVPATDAVERAAPLESMRVPAPKLAITSVAPAKKSGGAGALIGGIAFLAAVAAAGLFIVRSHAQKTEAQIAPQGVIAEAPKALEAPAAPQIQPQIQAAPTEPVAKVAQLDSPAAPAMKTDDALVPKTTAKTSTPKITTKAAVAANDSDNAKPAIDPKLVAKDLPPSPAEASGPLGDAMKQAAGPIATSAAVATNDTAQFAPGSVPQKPSQGAVIGALGAALPSARECLGPDDPVSRATVVFGSSGSVQSVSVSGSAAGKPAEACIKTALSKVKVPPFAQPTYTANANIRPN